jgi:PQQ enzyme repeat
MQSFHARQVLHNGLLAVMSLALLAGSIAWGRDGSGGESAQGGSAAPAPAAQAGDVTTYHADIARTGAYLNETSLTKANVNSASFGRVGFLAVDGKVDAQPLYLGNVTINGAAHNVVYAATEHDSVYAFDADSGAMLWQQSVLGRGETTSDDRDCGQITPEIGITSTPVIDRSRGNNGAIYVVGMSKDRSGAYHQRLHALDLASGAQVLGGPTEIQASYPGRGANSSHGRVVFDPKQYAERQSLLLLNGNIYLGWTSHCDLPPYGGWVMAYSADTLAQTSVLSVTPNGSEGSIWMSGAGFASDGSSIYFLDANGTFDTTLDAQGFPINGDYGNSFMKLATNGGLSVADYFAISDTVAQSDADVDFGSGGALLLPDQTDASGVVRHLAVGAGKDHNIYVVNRDAMGKFNRSSNNIWQTIRAQLPNGEFGMPAYFNATVYYGGVGDHIKAFAVINAKLSRAPSSQSAGTFTYPGSTPSISANGTSNGILWAAENGHIAVLHAYDASDLSKELYNSNQVPARDRFGAGNKFITPMIAHGRVFVGTTHGVAVFGLLH